VDQVAAAPAVVAGEDGKMFKQVIWLTLFCTVLIWSAIGPKDYYTWLLEVLPALIGLAVLVWSRQRFPLTPLVYILILIHCIILMVGGHYTYAEVPAGDWVSNLFGWQRNNYDKLGHLAQGFVPAMICREIFIRKQVVAGKWWRSFLICCFCLAFSAFYELLEWWTALLSGAGAEAFLGTQGYLWDTQSDMLLALLGALLALITLSRLHDRQLMAL
jgi:putative membrane protein